MDEVVSLNDFLFQSCIWGERVISAFASRERYQIIHMVLLKKKSKNESCPHSPLPISILYVLEGGVIEGI